MNLPTDFLHYTLEGKEISFQEVAEKHPQVLKLIVEEACQATSWAQFELQTEAMAVSEAKKKEGENWRLSQLLVLQRDLMAQVGIRERELAGKQTESFKKLSSMMKRK